MTLIDGARTAPSPVALLEELCTRLVAADVDIRRGAVYVETLHPTIVGRRFLWEIGEPVTDAEASFLFAPTETYRNTPIREVYETGKTLRRELHLDSYPDDYSIVGEFRADGMTDYIACPLHFLNGEIHAVFWNTRRPGGLLDADIASLERVTAPLARMAEVYALRRIAENLLNTYVGERSGSQILAGNLRRGDTEIIEAAIWLSDLREYTTVSGTERSQL